MPSYVNESSSTFWEMKSEPSAFNTDLTFPITFFAGIFSIIKLDWCRRDDGAINQGLEINEIKTLRLQGRDLESATDDQVQTFYKLLGCSLRSRISNFIRFRIKTWL